MLVRLRQFTSEGQDVELNNCDPNGRSYRSKDIALKSVEREEKLRHFSPLQRRINVDESWKIDENTYKYKDVIINGRK